MNNLKLPSTIITSLSLKDIDAFTIAFKQYHLTEADRQQLLSYILSNLYHKKYFSFFIKVFDIILYQKTNLNFSLDIDTYLAPSLLSLVASKADIQLFDYFVRQGAIINYVIKRTDRVGEEYCTCLDFLLEIYTDKFDSYDATPFDTEFEDIDLDEEGSIQISKSEYNILKWHSYCLYRVIYLDRLITHIKARGGKTYLQTSYLHRTMSEQ